MNIEIYRLISMSEKISTLVTEQTKTLLEQLLEGRESGKVSKHISHLPTNKQKNERSHANTHTERKEMSRDKNMY